MHKGSTYDTRVHDAQTTHTYLITQDKQIGSTHIQTHARYKTKTSKGSSNFKCKQFEYNLQPGGTLDKR